MNDVQEKREKEIKMKLKSENGIDKPFVELNAIIIKSMVKDQLPQELINKTDYFFKACDPFFNRFYILRKNEETYSEIFNGYKDAKHSKDLEQLNVYDKKLDSLIEKYQITRNDFELYLKDTISKEDIVLFNVFIGRIYRLFIYAVKNNKGLGYFKVDITQQPIRLNLEKFDPFAGLCKFQGLSQPISINLQENDLNLLESERGSCYFSGSVYCHPRSNELHIEIVFESQDLNILSKQGSKIRKRKFPLPNQLEKQRIN